MSGPTTTEAHYGWEVLEGGLMHSRPLTSMERLFSMLNSSFYSQNCPFIGAQVSVQGPLEHTRPFFSDVDIQERARLAFQKTRWKYPAVACRVIDNNQMIYRRCSAMESHTWAQRTVHVMQGDHSWLLLHERLTREVSLPSKDGDCCFVYIVPRQAMGFDILIHAHHALTDGSGLRSILHEFLTHMVGNSPIESTCWGQEIDRLLPAAIDLSTEAEKTAPRPRVRQEDLDVFMSGLFSPDIGLPLYRPDILAVTKENRGTSFLTHTFEAEIFLPNLLNKCRQHNNKLTSIIQAALFRAVYEFAESPPDPARKYTCLAAIDLRNRGRLKQPFGEKNFYAFNAIASEVISIPCNLLSSIIDPEALWEVAAYINAQYVTVSASKSLAQVSNEIIGRVLEDIGNSSHLKSSVRRPQTSPYYVSDPAGENQLSHSYSENEGGSELILESFQVASNQNLAKV